MSEPSSKHRKSLDSHHKPNTHASKRKNGSSGQSKKPPKGPSSRQESKDWEHVT